VAPLARNCLTVLLQHSTPNLQDSVQGSNHSHFSLLVLKVAPFGQNFEMVASSQALSVTNTFFLFAASLALCKTRGHPGSLQQYLPATGTTTFPPASWATRIYRIKCDECSIGGKKELKSLHISPRGIDTQQGKNLVLQQRYGTGGRKRNIDHTTTVLLTLLAWTDWKPPPDVPGGLTCTFERHPGHIIRTDIPAVVCT